MSTKPLKHGETGDTVVRRSSRKHDDEGHSGAWKVAFADFCLALLCLFLVLWVMAAREQERIREVLRAPGGHVMDEGQGIMPETLGGPRGSLLAREPVPRRDRGGVDGPAKSGGEPAEPFSAPRVRYESQSELAALALALSRLSAEAGLESNVQTVVTPQGLRVMLHDTDKQGMFQLGSAVPSERFGRLLRRMGPLFAQMENQVLLVGHTDALQYADRSHAAYSNWTLSSQRAMAARVELLAGGMPADSILQVVGMADRAPLDAGDARAGVNRRIELLVLTSQQARIVSAMFGLPGETQPLIDGADSSLPDTEALKALRERLLAQKGGDGSAP